MIGVKDIFFGGGEGRVRESGKRVAVATHSNVTGYTVIHDARAGVT